MDVEGITLEDLRKRYAEEVEKTLVIRMLVDREIRPKVELSEAEVRRFFEDHAEEVPEFPERYVLGRIYIEPKATAEGESAAAAELREIAEQVEAGEDFGELAKIFSDGPSAPNGGDLGHFSRGDMDPSFEEAAFALSESRKLSDVVKTPFGLHLIQYLGGDGVRIHVRHILKRPQTGSDGRDEARVKARAIHDSLTGGEEYERLARAHSDDRSSAAQGGEVGTFAVSDVTPDMKAALDGVPVGGISEVVEAPDGFHIFRIIAFHPAGKPAFEEVRDEIRIAASQEKQQRFYDEYITKLREEFYVDIQDQEGEGE